MLNVAPAVPAPVGETAAPAASAGFFDWLAGLPFPIRRRGLALMFALLRPWLIDADSEQGVRGFVQILSVSLREGRRLARRRLLHQVIFQVEWLALGRRSRRGLIADVRHVTTDAHDDIAWLAAQRGAIIATLHFGPYTLGVGWLLHRYFQGHVLSDDGCRPFSRGRRGLVLGEGAAMFVLEDYDRAVARGADILAELTGFGLSCDAGSITAPNADGMARAMRGALADARLPVDAVDHVNAHGTGTQANDATECQALSIVFGDRLSEMPVTASKSVLGHALGASGAFELAAAVMTLRGGMVPPTANHVEPDPDCAVDCVPNAARDHAVTTVLSNSFAFGGLNAALVVRRA